MLRNVFLASLGYIAMIPAMALAQSAVPFGNPTPLSNTGGYAAREMQSIYRTGVGTGYSVNSLNSITLNQMAARVPNVGQSSARGSRLSTGLPSTGPSSKPFSGFSPAPTVSPYLNLFREDLDGQSDFNYQTLVRPQLQQQETNERLQRQNQEISQRLQSIAAQSDFNPSGDRNLPPTGHQTVFGYHSHFYPQQARRR